MAPVATNSSRRPIPQPVVKSFVTAIKSRLFNRSARSSPHRIVSGSGNNIFLSNGWKILDASGGAAVSCIGRVNERVEKAMIKQMRLGLSYVSSMAFDTDVAEKLASFLTTSTNDEMSKVVFYSSGSEAVEAAFKLAVQYHAKEKMYPEPTRTQFIARDRSYHGATLGALALSGHKARKEVYQSVLPRNVSRIAPCNPYRDRRAGESDAEYIGRLKNGLRQKILELGPKNVAGFIVEPVVGAALGCVPAVPGYLKAMREVCDEYGVLLIMDEVMCGMGRIGYLHAWQKENVVPDIQLVGKGLAGGFQPLSAMLIRKNIVDAFQNGPGSGSFIHGHTFQNFTLACAAGLEVQKIVERENLVHNVRVKGKVLSAQLKERLGNHPHVGDIRGEGLFWGIEFVYDKATKEPFHPADMVAWNMFQMGLAPPYEVHVYPGSGTVDGQRGDHIIISPAYNTTDAEINMIVDRVGRLVEDFFDTITPSVP